MLVSPATTPTSRLPPSLVVLMALFAGAAVIVLPLLEADARRVALPMTAAAIFALGFVALLTRRAGRFPLDEIGLWYMAALAVYTVMPLLVFLLVGLEYTPLNDIRLFSLNPSPAAVGRMGWWYSGYLAAFAGTYLAVRGKAAPQYSVVPEISRWRLAVIVALWLLVNVIFLAIASVFGGGGGYASSYAAIAEMPLAVRQLLRLAKSMEFVVSLGVLVWIFNDYSRRRWILALWFGYQVFSMVVALGARTDLVLFVSACLILYHLRVRPIPAGVAMGLGFGVLVAFLLLGVLRTFAASGPGEVSASLLGGEFESLFGNAMDLHARKVVGGIPPLPAGFHLADLMALLPSQLLPFTKVDVAAWYMRTFYPEQAARGLAYAFGVVPQSILGFGLPELLVRGGFLGALFGCAYRYYRRYQDRLWVVVGYLWLTLWGYQTFRASTLVLLSPFVQQFLFTVFVIETGRRVLLGAAARHTELVQAKDAGLPTAGVPASSRAST